MKKEKNNKRKRKKKCRESNKFIEFILECEIKHIHFFLIYFIFFIEHPNEEKKKIGRNSSEAQSHYRAKPH